MGHLFQILIYQPFLNLLVGIYWLLDLLPNTVADMGVAVIIFTIAIRIILLPLTISGERSEKERREVAEKVKAVEDQYGTQPLLLEQEIKKVFRSNRRIIVSELIDLVIQVTIALMLWRIFATGLPGEDIHLIYKWMPKVDLPFNLIFLGKYDLSHPHLFLNLIQSLLIFVIETLNIITSPYHVSRKEVVRMQLTLPIVSFIVFMFLPAGKKLFVITTLSFSIVYKIVITAYRWVKRKFGSTQEKEPEKTSPTPAEPAPTPETAKTTP